VIPLALELAIIASLWVRTIKSINEKINLVSAKRPNRYTLFLCMNGIIHFLLQFPALVVRFYVPIALSISNPVNNGKLFYPLETFLDDISDMLCLSSWILDFFFLLFF
jgi:hypothetical protein